MRGFGSGRGAVTFCGVTSRRSGGGVRRSERTVRSALKHDNPVDSILRNIGCPCSAASGLPTRTLSASTPSPRVSVSAAPFFGESSQRNTEYRPTLITPVPNARQHRPNSSRAIPSPLTTTATAFCMISSARRTLFRDDDRCARQMNWLMSTTKSKTSSSGRRATPYFLSKYRTIQLSFSTIRSRIVAGVWSR